MSKTDVVAFDKAAGSSTGVSFAGSPGFVEKFLRRNDVHEMTTIPPSTLSDYIRMGLFPRPYRLNPSESTRHGSAVWKLSEVLEFINTRHRAE